MSAAELLAERPPVSSATTWTAPSRQAGDDIAKRLDLARIARLKLRPGAADLDRLEAIALDHENLDHVLGELGFVEIVAELPMVDAHEPMPAGRTPLHPKLRTTAEWWPDAFGPVLIAAGEGVGHVAVDIGSGAWRALPLGGDRGVGLLELITRRLNLSRWRAAVWLARACGLPHIPEVPRQ